MEELKIKNDCTDLFETLSVSLERREVIQEHCTGVMFELLRPGLSGIAVIKDDQVLLGFLKIAKTDEERVILAYMAGKTLQAMEIKKSPFERLFKKEPTKQ